MARQFCGSGVPPASDRSARCDRVGWMKRWIGSSARQVSEEETVFMADDRLHVPAREIPVPEYLSEEAHACLAAGPSETAAPWPPLDDVDAWRERIAWQDKVLLDLVGGSASTEGVGYRGVGGGRRARLCRHAGRGLRRPPRLSGHPRRCTDLGWRRVLPGPRSCVGTTVRSQDVVRRLPDASRAPIPHTARRLRQRLPLIATKPRTQRHHRRRRLCRCEPRSGPHPACRTTKAFHFPRLLS